MENLNNMQEEKNRIDIIIRYLNGKCSTREENELLGWIDQSSENEKYFNKFKYAWIASAQLKHVCNEDVEKAAKEFRFNILQSEKIKNESKRKVISFPLTFLSIRVVKYAALLLIAFFLGSFAQKYIGKGYSSSKNEKNRFFTFESPKGSRAVATLPDGTKVWLNALSKISYSSDYNVQERIIMLEGEAYFDVSTNTYKPFIVKARNLDIKAYGTLFNVKAYAEENKVITTLVEGKVTIEGNDEANKRFVLNMDPKQCVIYYTDKKSVGDAKSEKSAAPDNPIQEVTGENISEVSDIQIVRETLSKPEINATWKDQRWVVANEDLKSLSVMLERRYNVNIKFLDEESKEYHFTGIIENETIEQVLTILSLTVPVKYRIDRNNIELVLNHELKNRYINALKSNPNPNPNPNPNDTTMSN